MDRYYIFLILALVIVTAVIAAISFNDKFVGTRTFAVSAENGISECSDICQSLSRGSWCAEERKDCLSYQTENETESCRAYRQQLLVAQCTFSLSSSLVQEGTPNPETSECQISCK